MKRIKSLVISCVSAAALIGCGEKPAESPSPATPPAASTKPAGQTTGQAASEAASKVVAEVKEQSAAAVTAVQEQAKAAYTDLSQQLIAKTKGTSEDLVKSISSDLQGRVQKLSESLKGNDAAGKQLDGGVTALLNNQDGQAVSGLSGLSAAKLTPDQTSLAKDVYNAAAALVTQRNFSSIEGMNSDVAKLSTAVLNGNYTEALPPLQKIYSQSTLTTQQKDLLGKMYDSYMPAGWKDSATKLQQGLDTLKKFGQ